MGNGNKLGVHEVVLNVVLLALSGLKLMKKNVLTFAGIKLI